MDLELIDAEQKCIAEQHEQAAREAERRRRR